MKKRGFGKGRWNRVGGKPLLNEAIDKTAIRETEEEIAVTLTKISHRATLDFYFPHLPDWNQQVIVYVSNSWNGVPRETEEMKPAWYPKSSPPFDLIWPDDKYWLPQVLAGKSVRAEFLFGEKDTILDSTVKEVLELE